MVLLCEFGSRSVFSSVIHGVISRKTGITYKNNSENFMRNREFNYRIRDFQRHIRVQEQELIVVVAVTRVGLSSKGTVIAPRTIGCGTIIRTG